MKIAFIIPSKTNKGPILVCKDLVEYLISINIDCHVYYFDSMEEISFSCNSSRINFFSKIDFSEYDLVHCHMFRPDLFLYLNRKLRGFKGKAITTIHTAIYDDFKFYSRAVALFLPKVWESTWKGFNKLVVLTNVAKFYYEHTQLPISVIHNGRSISNEKIDEDDLLFFSEVKSKYKILGTVAAYDDRKGLIQIVEVLFQFPDMAFVIIGPGSKETRQKMEELSIKLNIKDRLFFLGPRSNGDRYMSQFDLFVIPSISEGLPLALLEAAGHGASIVCSDIPVFKECFLNEEVSFFELFNIESLAMAISLALSNKKDFSDRSRLKYIEKYTKIAMGEKYKILYDEVINENL